MGSNNEWDVVIRRAGPHGHWWWNAWHDATSTELSGTAATRDAAREAIDTAITAAPSCGSTRADVDVHRDAVHRRHRDVPGHPVRQAALAGCAPARTGGRSAARRDRVDRMIDEKDS